MRSQPHPGQVRKGNFWGSHFAAANSRITEMDNSYAPLRASCRTISTSVVFLKLSESRMRWQEVHYASDCRWLQAEHVGDEILLFLPTQFKLQHQVEEFDDVVECRTTAVVQVRG